jgi:ribosomal protein L37E
MDRMAPRAARAWRERMAVSPAGDGRYTVTNESGGSYTVDLPRKHCTCPNHTMRGERCKHLRRVAIEITAGRVPKPGFRAADCLVCGRETFVPEATRLPLCEFCGFAPGERVRDRETGDLLVVSQTTDHRADEVAIDALDVTVASHPTNRSYDPGEPVVEAVYPGGDHPYSFPRSRLARQPRAVTTADSTPGMSG